MSLNPRRVAVLGGLALVGQLSCGDDGGVCPTGDCTLPGSTVVKWAFNRYVDRGFIGDTCLDVGITAVRVTATNVGDPLLTETAEKACGEGQATFTGLEPGVYNLALEPLDAGGGSLINAPIAGQLAAASSGAVVETTLIVPAEAWTGTYTGQFLFTISWNGATCAAAVPPITTQTLTLHRGGTPLPGMTENGQRVDGTDPKPCQPFGAGEFEFIQNLPFGPATFRVVGQDSGGGTHEEEFETFIGIGISNPTLVFDVTTPDAAVPDAAIDAPIDAAPDAAPDAT